MFEGLDNLILVLTLAGVGLIVLAILLPWFVFRISSHAKEMRNQLKEVNKSLKVLLDK